MTDTKLYNLTEETYKYIYEELLPEEQLNKLLNDKVDGKYKIINHTKIDDDHERYNIDHVVDFYKNARDHELQNQSEITKDDLCHHYDDVGYRHKFKCEWEVYDSIIDYGYITNLYDHTGLGAKKILVYKHVFDNWDMNDINHSMETVETDVKGDRWIDMFIAIDKIIRYTADYLSRRVSQLMLDGNTGILSFQITHDG